MGIPSVNVENKSGARKLVDHLIEVHDYRRIAFLTGPAGIEDSCWREAGYEAASQLIRLIRTGAAETEILLPTQLVVRRSCGCA